MKSPLIMGNDIRIITPKALSILSNPAVIAISQDPAGSSAARRYFYSTNSTSPYDGSSLQMWSGSLTSTTGGTYTDQVVLLINGSPETQLMNASLAEIFVDSGPSGKAKQVGLSWEVRDLWAGRMSDEIAAAIIAGNSTMSSNGTNYEVWNATATSYKDGLAAKSEVLLGSVTQTLAPMGTIQASVAAHGAAMFRLRYVDTAKSEL